MRRCPPDMRADLIDRFAADTMRRSVTGWHPLSYAKWHFENCHFETSAGNMWSIVFPWRGSFRFYKNEFGFNSTLFGSHWLFNFRVGSRILFQGNDFKRNHLQISCTTSETDQDANDGEHSA